MSGGSCRIGHPSPSDKIRQSIRYRSRNISDISYFRFLNCRQNNYPLFCIIRSTSHYRSQLFLLQKKALRLITFSAYREHTNPLFIKYQIIKFHDLIYYQNAIFSYKLHISLSQSISNFSIHNSNKIIRLLMRNKELIE